MLPNLLRASPIAFLLPVAMEFSSFVGVSSSDFIIDPSLGGLYAVTQEDSVGCYEMLHPFPPGNHYLKPVLPTSPPLLSFLLQDTALRHKVHIYSKYYFTDHAFTATSLCKSSQSLTCFNGSFVCRHNDHLSYLYHP